MRVRQDRRVRLDERGRVDGSRRVTVEGGQRELLDGRRRQDRRVRLSGMTPARWEKTARWERAATEVQLDVERRA